MNRLSRERLDNKYSNKIDSKNALFFSLFISVMVLMNSFDKKGEFDYIGIVLSGIFFVFPATIIFFITLNKTLRFKKTDKERHHHNFNHVC